MDRETNPLRIAERMIKSLKSNLHAFIFDRNIIDSRIVDRIIGLSGYEGIINRHAQGTIIVYYIDPVKIRRRCLYEKCADEKNEYRSTCVNRCVREETSRISKELAEAIAEIAKNLET